MREKRHSRLAAGFAIVLLLCAGVAIVVAASGPSIDADPNEVDAANATYQVTITVGSQSSSMNGLEIDLSNANSNVSDVGTEDVLTAGIDRDDDGSGTTIDESITDDLSGVDTSGGGEILTLTFGGSYSLYEGDEIVVVFDDVQNPASAGTYDVPLDINPQSSGGEATGTLQITDATPTATPTPSPTATPTPSPTATPTPSPSPTPTSSPTATSTPSPTDTPRDDDPAGGGDEGGSPPTDTGTATPTRTDTPTATEAGATPGSRTPTTTATSTATVTPSATAPPAPEAGVTESTSPRSETEDGGTLAGWPLGLLLILLLALVVGYYRSRYS